MSWFSKQKSLDDIYLVAWHHMLNDPWLSTYTMDEHGREQRKWVNPKFAWQRSMDEMGKAVQSMIETVQDQLFGAFRGLVEPFGLMTQTISTMFEGIRFDPSFVDPDVVD